MAARFRANQAGIEAMAATPAMERAMGVFAEKVRIVAETDPPIDTGQYGYDVNTPPGEEGGFEVTTGVENGRAYGRVTNNTPHAAYLEFGTRDMDAQRPLGKALDTLRGST